MAQLVVHIRDVSSGSPIAFVAVFVGSASAISDIQGNATLNMDPGTYALSVRAPGYVAAPGTPQSVSVPGEITVQIARVFL